MLSNNFEKIEQGIERAFALAKDYEWSIELLVKSLSEILKANLFILTNDYQLIPEASCVFCVNSFSELILETEHIEQKYYQKLLENSGTSGFDGIYRYADKLFLGNGDSIVVIIESREKIDYFEKVFLLLKTHISFLIMKGAKTAVVFTSKVSPINAIIDGRISDEDEIKSIIGFNDEEQLIRVAVFDNKGNGHNLHNTENLLYKVFESVKVSFLRGRIYAFVKMPKSKDPLENLVKTTWSAAGFKKGFNEDYLNTELCKLDIISSVSVAFGTIKLISTVADLTSQSIDILKKMKLYEDGNNIYFEYDYLPFIRYKQLVPPYLENNGIQSIKCLLEPDVVLLVKYDRKNNTDFLNVLYTYLQNNRNANSTAEKLFVHKNTVYYKIQQIQNIIMDNFDDSYLASRYLESIRLFEFITKYMGLDIKDFLY